MTAASLQVLYSVIYSFNKNVQILYLPEVWYCDCDGSGVAITDFGGGRISDELALQKRRIHFEYGGLREPVASE